MPMFTQLCGQQDRVCCDACILAQFHCVVGLAPPLARGDMVIHKLLPGMYVMTEPGVEGVGLVV